MFGRSNELSRKSAQHVRSCLVRELAGKKVFTKQVRNFGSRPNACFWLDGARVNVNHVCCFEMMQRVGFILVLQSILQ